MATRRTQIIVDVQGLADLQAMNTSMSRHATLVTKLTGAYMALNVVSRQFASGLVNVTNNFNTFNNTTNTTNNNITNMRSNLASANSAGGNFLGTLLRYRAVSLVFGEVEKAVGAVVSGMVEMEKQAARTARITGARNTPVIRASIALEAARTGADIKEIGEASYQIAPFVKDANAQLAALQATMNLVIGTEVDARDAARGVIQVYNEFGSQLDKTATQQENFRRIGELYAIAFKTTNTEVHELTSSLKYLGPVAAAAKIPIEQIFALLGALDKGGLRERTAGTGGAAFLLNLISNYKTKLPGKDFGGISYKGSDYAFDAPLNPKTGGIDLQKTLQSISTQIDRIRHDGLPDAERRAEMFIRAVSGSTQSFRVTAVVEGIKDTLKDMEQNARLYQDALKGATNESEALRKSMTTTAQEFQKVWVGAIAVISNAIDLSGLRGWLHGIADDVQQVAAAIRTVQDLRTGWQQGDQQTLSGTGRSAMTRTQETIQQALANIHQSRFHPNLGTFLTSPLDQATNGMTQAQKEMISHRYLPGGPHNTAAFLNEAQMRRDLATLQSQLANPQFGTTPAPYGPVNVRPTLNADGSLSYRAGGGPPPISPGAKALEKQQRDADRLAKEAADKRLETARTLADSAETSYQIAVNDKSDNRKSDQEIHNLALQADSFRNAYDKLRDDTNAIRQRSAGLSGSAADFAKEQAARREESAKEHQAYLEYYAEAARTKYGPTSDLAYKRAQEAQRGAEAGASGVELQKLRDHATGPIADYLAARVEFEKDVADKAKEALQAIEEGYDSVRKAGEQFAADSSRSAQDVIGTLQDRIQARQRGLRPNYAPGLEDRQQGALVADAADIDKTLALLRKTFPGATDQIAELAKEAANASAALVDFADNALQKAKDLSFQTLTDKYQKQLSDIENKNLPNVGETPRQAEARERQLLLRKLEFANKQYLEISSLSSLTNSFLTGGAPSEKEKKDVENADIARRQADLAIKQFDRATAVEKYNSVHGPLQEQAQQSVLNFLHGQGSVGDVFKSLGDTVINAALEPWVKKATDPLVNAATKQILALQDNSNALDALSATLSGGSGTGVAGGGGGFAGIGAAAAAGAAAAIGAAVEGGTSSGPTVGIGGPIGAVGGRGGGPLRFSGPHGGGLTNTEMGINAALSAYSIASTSAQQGVNGGNLLGSVISGASLGATFGGPIGAAIGGVAGAALDLIGGLFHQNNKPTATPQDLNPAYYNAPSAFDVGAYNYSAYGKLPHVQDVGFEVKAAPGPVINVYVDGAKVTAKQEIARQTNSVNVNLVNVQMDRHSPL